MPLLKQKLKRLDKHRQCNDFFPAMKLFLIMTIVTLFLAGCGQSEHEHSHGHGDGEHHQDEDGGTPLFYAHPRKSLIFCASTEGNER
jgi:hypothetical protein